MQAALAEHAFLRGLTTSRACFSDREETQAWERASTAATPSAAVMFPVEPQRVVVSCGGPATDGLVDALVSSVWQIIQIKYTLTCSVRVHVNGEVALVVPSAPHKWDSIASHAFANSLARQGRDVYVITTIRKSERRAEAHYNAGPLRSLATLAARVPSYIPPLEPSCIIGGIAGALMHQCRIANTFCLIICAPRESVLDMNDTIKPLATGLLSKQHPLFRFVVGEAACDAALQTFDVWATQAMKKDERESRATEPEGMYS